MILTADIATLEKMPGLDFKGPFDELAELRAVLTTQQIAEFTGLRRETISRARPDSRFRPRTERALGDLYLVVTRMRSAAGGDLGQLAAILRRPQAILGERSIADLLKEGRVDEVLAHLVDAAPAARPARPDPGPPAEGAVQAFLAANPELDSLLPEIEAKVREHFGPELTIERAIIEEFDGDPDDGAEDQLYLRVRNDLSVEENVERLLALSERERDLLRPVRGLLAIGFL